MWKYNFKTLQSSPVEGITEFQTNRLPCTIYLFMIRPRGVLSKNAIGARSIRYKREACIFREAYVQPMAAVVINVKAESAEKEAK